MDLVVQPRISTPLLLNELKGGDITNLREKMFVFLNKRISFQAKVAPINLIILGLLVAHTQLRLINSHN